MAGKTWIEKIGSRMFVTVFFNLGFYFLNKNVNFKFKLATHGDPVARYHQPSNFSNRVGP